MQGLTFGQYIPQNSLIHGLDPRTKMMVCVLTMAAALLAPSLQGALLVMLFAFILVGLSRVSLSMYWRGIKPVIIVILIAVAFQLFLVPGNELFHIGRLKATAQGLNLGILVAVRLFIVFLLAQILTITTSPMELTAGLESLLRPLKGLRLPVHELVMVVTIALRFVPVLFEETDRIVKAQVSRGADLNVARRGGIRNLVAVVAPLFSRAFQRADDLAMAMEARCYAGGEGRTRMRRDVLHMQDYIMLVVTVSVSAIALLI